MSPRWLRPLNCSKVGNNNKRQSLLFCQLDGEEEFWLNQHYSPDEHGKLPDSPDGMSFQRWAHMMQENNVLNDWGADDWARYVQMCNFWISY